MSALATSSVPQPVKRIAAGRARTATGDRRRVVGAALDEVPDLVGGQRRVDSEQERGGCAHLRRGERRADRVAELERPAVGVRVGAARVVGDEVRRDRREHVVARRGDVDVHRVAVRVVRDGSVATHSRDADHVRERSGIRRVPPRCRRRLRAVPDRRDDDGAFRVRVLDGGALERRVGVERRVERVAHAAEAEVDDACALVDGPADPGDLGGERDVAVGGDDLRDDQSCVEREAGHPDPVRRVGGDLAGDERPVSLLVVVRRAADERLRRDDASGEVGMRSVDAGVDDRDLDRREARHRRPERPGLVVVEVPLLGGVGLGVGERGRDGRDDERRKRDEEREPSHCTVNGADRPTATPWPGAARTR